MILKGKLWDACNADTGEKIAVCISGKFINVLDLKKIIISHSRKCDYR